MSIHAKCPACGEQFRRPDGLAGKLEKCPECRHVFRLPTADSVAEVDFFAEQQVAEEPPAVTEEAPIEETPLEVPADADELAVVEEAPPPAEPDDLTIPFEFEPVSEAELAPSKAVLPDSDGIGVLPGRTFSREAPGALDCAAVAAAEVCAGKTPGKIESELVRRGMSPDDARLLTGDMFAIHKRLQQKKRSGKSWLRTLVGLVLVAVCGASIGYERQLGIAASATKLYTAAAVAMAGVIFLIIGVSGLILGNSNKVDAKSLLAAWQKGE